MARVFLCSGLVSMPRVLVADDQPDVLLALRLLLKGAGWETEAVESTEAILDAVAGGCFDAVLMDLNYTRDTTSGREGLDLVPRLRGLDDHVPVIVMTAWGSIDLAVEAMRRGASDFVLKPWNNGALLDLLRSHVGGSKGRASEGPADRDLAIARRVQRQLLPQNGPALSTLEYAGRCLQAGAVGGDAYDFLDFGPGRLGLVLADASGKGIGAALLMANLQATLRSQVTLATGDLAAHLGMVNALFYSSTAPEHYATLFLGAYDDATRRLRYVNCGHNPPVLLHAGGRGERLAPTAPVLGLMDDWSGTTALVSLAGGDTLVVFSDGLTEARNSRAEEFGDGRLLEALRATQGRPATAILEDLLAAALAFAGATPEDDLTMVVARGL